MAFRIKNWQRFQHFKNRNPPWVKVHKTLLVDPEWFDLSGQDAKILVMLWLIASQDEQKSGQLPPVNKLAFQLRVSEEKLLQSLQRLTHWVQRNDISVASERYHPVSKNASESESESESDNSETETEAHARSDEFETFWKAYPRKVAKKAALKAWKNAKDKPDLAYLLGAIERVKQTEDWKKDNGKFIPHPATWLNQGRWADEVAIAKPSGPVIMAKDPIPKAFNPLPTNPVEGVPMPDDVRKGPLGRILKSVGQA